MRLARTLALAGCLIAAASPARADATLFAGGTTTPNTRAMKGFAFGGGILAVGFEFEYSDTGEDALEGAPSLRTGMGNVLLQTPLFIGRFQPYFTTGAGLYREALNDETETQIGANTGGGVKVKLVGPLRVRVDYRLFKLRGDPLFSVVHRVYVGANLAF